MLQPDQLTPPERKVWDAIATGEVVNLGAGSSDRDSAGGATWGGERSIRGQLLAELLAEGKNRHAPPASFLRLQGARIAGGLDLEAVTVRCPVMLQDCYFDQDAEVTLTGARVISLGLHGCHLPGLAAEQIETRSNLELSLGFTATGEVNLRDARIGGRLDFRGAVLRNADGHALTANGLTVDQDMFCDTGFQAEGEVGLTGAHISGTLSFKGATLRNRGGPALIAARLTVGGDMLCEGAFWVLGEVGLVGAEISGMLDFRGARLYNPRGIALAADGLTVAQIMLCGQGFRAYGEVRLVGARIGGVLSFTGATLRNPSGLALNANRLTVDHYMLCRQVQAKGEINLLGAHISGVLHFQGANLHNPDGCALNANRLIVNEDLHCEDGFYADGEVRLRDARLGGLYDSQPWPAQLLLDGLTYDRLVDVSSDSRADPRAKQRVGWLRRSPDGYTPQPYEQLAAVYRRAGQPQAARRVLISKQWDRRSTLRPPGKLLNWLEWGAVGYGYRTWLALLWLALWWLAGWTVFDHAHAQHNLVLAKPSETHPSYHGAIYSLDTLLPVVDLRQQAVWVPHGGVQWWASASILAGWVLTTAVVAGLTGVLKRD